MPVGTTTAARSPLHELADGRDDLGGKELYGAHDLDPAQSADIMLRHEVAVSEQLVLVVDLGHDVIRLADEEHRIDDVRTRSPVRAGPPAATGPGAPRTASRSPPVGTRKAGTTR